MIRALKGRNKATDGIEDIFVETYYGQEQILAIISFNKERKKGTTDGTSSDKQLLSIKA